MQSIFPVGLTVVAPPLLFLLWYIVLLVEHAPLEDAARVAAGRVHRLDREVVPIYPVDHGNREGTP